MTDKRCDSRYQWTLGVLVSMSRSIISMRSLLGPSLGNFLGSSFFSSPSFASPSTDSFEASLSGSCGSSGGTSSNAFLVKGFEGALVAATVLPGTLLAEEDLVCAAGASSSLGLPRKVESHSTTP